MRQEISQIQIWMFPVGSTAGALSYPNLGPFFQGEHLKTKQLASTGSGKRIYAILSIRKKPVAFWDHPSQGCLLQHICQAENGRAYLQCCQSVGYLC